jgi:hypothetical protein
MSNDVWLQKGSEKPDVRILRAMIVHMGLPELAKTADLARRSLKLL